MRIALDRSKPVPLARQIQAHLERLVREGLLPPGAKLPATRELADELGVNRATVVLAYEELVAAGWARARVGQGTFVAERPTERAEVDAAPRRRLAPIEWSELFSRSAQIIGAEEERRRNRAAPSLGGAGAADLSARHAGVPVVRRAAGRRPVGRRGPPPGRVRAGARAPGPEALLLPADVSQSPRARDDRGDAAPAPRRGGPPPGTDRG